MSIAAKLGIDEEAWRRRYLKRQGPAHTRARREQDAQILGAAYGDQHPAVKKVR